MKIKSRQILTANHHCNILQCIIHSCRSGKSKKNLHNKKRIPPRIAPSNSRLQKWNNPFVPESQYRSDCFCCRQSRECGFLMRSCVSEGADKWTGVLWIQQTAFTSCLSSEWGAVLSRGAKARKEESFLPRDALGCCSSECIMFCRVVFTKHGY